MHTRPRRTLAEARERYQRLGPNRVIVRYTYGGPDVITRGPTIRKALRWTIAQGTTRNRTAARRVARLADEANTRRLERDAWGDDVCQFIPMRQSVIDAIAASATTPAPGGSGHPTDRQEHRP